MKEIKKLISLNLVLLLLLTMLPISVLAAEAKELKLDAPVAYTVADRAEEHDFTFTPEKDGLYTFNTNPGVGTTFNLEIYQNGRRIPSTYEQNTTATLELSAGVTYTIKHNAEEQYFFSQNRTYPRNYEIFCIKETYPEIFLGEETAFVVEKKGETKDGNHSSYWPGAYLRFVPPETGLYTFSASIKGYISVIDINSGVDFYDYVDSNGEEDTYKLEGGRPYLIVFNGGELNQSASLKVEKAASSIDNDGYYTTPENRLFYVYALNASYPAPTGFEVQVGGSTFKAKRPNGFFDSIDVTIPKEYTGDVIVSHPDYYDFVIPAEMTGQNYKVTMVPKTITGPVPQALLLDERDGYEARVLNLMSDVKYFNEVGLLDDTESEYVKLYPVVDWNGHGAGTIWLQQGDIKVPLKNRTENVIDWTQYYFKSGEDIYLYTEGADGSTSRVQVNIKLYAKWENININLGDSLSIDPSESVQGDLSILEGHKLEFDFSELSDKVIPIKFKIEGDGTVEGVIGLTLLKGKNTNAVYDSMKEMLSGKDCEDRIKNYKETAKRISELKEKGAKPVESFTSWGVSGNIMVLGYFTGKILDGRFGLNEMKAALVFSGSVSGTHNTFVYSIPAYFKISLAAKISAYISMEYDEALDWFTSDGDNHFDGSVSISGEAGPGWEGYFSGGVKGTGSVKMKSVIPITKKDTTLSLEAGLSFVGTLAGMSGEWKLDSFTKEKVFYDGGEWCWKDPDDSTNAQALYFVPDLSYHTMSVSEDNHAIVNGVSGYTSPSMVKLSDGRLLAVWVADVMGRSAIDQKGVYYSICTNGAWSNPVLVQDDGTNDSMPQLYQQNGVTYLAWQNYSTIFDTDTLPDYETVLAQMTNVCAIFDAETNSWNAPVEETPEWYLADPELPEDYGEEWPATGAPRQVIKADGKQTVLYTSADENGIYQVWGIVYDGSAWGEPVQLTNCADEVNGFYGMLEGQTLTLLYAAGELANSDLILEKVPFAINLTATKADYMRETLIPGNALAISVSVRNNGTETANGVCVSVRNGKAEVYSENIDVMLLPGEEDILYVNYDLPEILDFDNLTVSVMPIMGEDSNLSDNSAECALHLIDLSAENVTATLAEGTTYTLVQVVNRGVLTSEPTELIYHRNKSDGETLGTVKVPALQAGELYNITMEFTSLEADEMVYVEVVEQDDENLIGNNISQAVVNQYLPLDSLKSDSTVNPAPGPSDDDNDEVYVPTTNPVINVKNDNDMDFSDASASEWYYTAVQYVVENGLMNGTSSTLFAPNATLTRAMLVQVLYNLEGRPTAASNRFTDVASGAWYAGAVAWAAEQGIVTGYSETRFGPDDAVTREQTAAIFQRYAKYKGLDVTASGALTQFSDADAVSVYAKDAVAWAVDAGLLTGKGSGSLDPAGTATRAEIAAILMRFCENVLK